MTSVIHKLKTPTTLIDELQKLGGAQPARPYSTIHASMLTYEGKKFCPREVALCDVTGRNPKDEWINPALQATFDLGWSVHHLVTDKWLSHIAHGHWRCVRCRARSPFGPKPETCEGTLQNGTLCGTKEFRYVEEVFEHSDLKVSGSIDLLAKLPGLEKLQAVEIKSIDKDEFKELKAPLAEHRIRSQLYLSLIQNSNSPVKTMISWDSCRILYVSKGFGTKVNGKITPFKEYTVPANPKALDPYLSKAQAVVRWRRDKVVPQGVCANSFSSRVKQCACPKECWGGKFPAGV